MTFSVRRASLLILGLTTSTLAGLGLAAPVSHATPLGAASVPAVAREADPRPNIVFITTDDQNVSDLQWMPQTRRLLAGRGFTFSEALSPHPLCCPARAEWVTGQYGQNNGVHHNAGVHGGYPALRSPSNTLARWLDTAGYQTAMVGKYMNGYRRADPKSLVGWNHWNPMIRGTMTYRHTTFLNDGHQRLHTDHVDDVVTKYAADYIKEFAGQEAPFFVWASNLAPHNRSGQGQDTHPMPADRHRGMFQGVRNVAEAKPSFAVPVVDAPVSGVSAETFDNLGEKFVARIEALQAVDEGVRRIVRTLGRTGELDNTYIIFTSDNGYLLGEHGLMGKNLIYDEAMRVPLLVRSPRPEFAGVTSQVPVTAVDIAPTIAELAGATPRRRVDGKSFAPLLRGQAQEWRDTQLIQTGTVSRLEAMPGWAVRGVRTSRWTYGVNQLNGTVELYDRREDPFELVNLASRTEYLPVLTELQLRATALQSCAGDSCNRTFGPVPEPLPEPVPEPLPEPLPLGEGG